MLVLKDVFQNGMHICWLGGGGEFQYGMDGWIETLAGRLNMSTS